MMRQPDDMATAYGGPGNGGALDMWLRRDLRRRFGDPPAERMPLELLLLATEIDEPE